MASPLAMPNGMYGGKLLARACLLLAVLGVPGWCVENTTLVAGTTYPLWPGKAPGAQGDTPEDIPALTVFLPKAGTASGSTCIICPGGAYGMRSEKMEGSEPAQWLAGKGITAFVLRYRIGPNYQHPIELGDAQRAIRFVRSHAGAWKTDPHRIVILGFSAGGHLASTVATHFDAGNASAPDPVDRVSCRPDLQILVYPVITMGEGTHANSRRNLLGWNPTPDLILLLSNEKQVTKATPPAFLVHPRSDTGVPPAVHTDRYAAALTAAGVPFEYIREGAGMDGHGFGLKDAWAKPCEQWLKAQKF